LILLFAFTVIILTVSGQKEYDVDGVEGLPIATVGPFQEVLTQTLRFIEDIWRNYFFLISVAKENKRLKKSLLETEAERIRCREIAQSHYRLRKILDLKQSYTNNFLVSEVIARDPTPWFKALIINKGSLDGIKKGAAVIVPQGIVGQVTEVTGHFAKVLLLIDQNNAADALVQRTRARGIIKGELGGEYILKYVLRKYDIKIDDIIISSGMDGVYPKGIQIGRVKGVTRKHGSSIFQEVQVKPFVDFETLEEVLVLYDLPKHDFFKDQ